MAAAEDAELALQGDRLKDFVGGGLYVDLVEVCAAEGSLQVPLLQLGLEYVPDPLYEALGIVVLTNWVEDGGGRRHQEADEAHGREIKLQIQVSYYDTYPKLDALVNLGAVYDQHAGVEVPLFLHLLKEL